MRTCGGSDINVNGETVARRYDIRFSFRKLMFFQPRVTEFETQYANTFELGKSLLTPSE